jgi:polar amino acid transport system substrate-binding protein
LSLAASARLGLASLVLLWIGAGGTLEAGWVATGRPLNLPTDQLRVGVDASYPPLAVTLQSGQVEGLEVDLAREVALRLGLELQLLNTDVGGGLDALIDDRYDAILAGLGTSPDLLDRVAFSRPYFDDGPRLVGLDVAPERLVGLRVGVEFGSAAEVTLRRLPEDQAPAAISRYDGPDDVLAGLTEGAVDAAVLDASAALLARHERPRLRLAGRSLAERPLSLALRRENRALQLAINEVLDNLQREGTLDDLAERWFGRSG